MNKEPHIGCVTFLIYIVDIVGVSFEAVNVATEGNVQHKRLQAWSADIIPRRLHQHICRCRQSLTTFCEALIYFHRLELIVRLSGDEVELFKMIGVQQSELRKSFLKRFLRLHDMFFMASLPLKCSFIDFAERHGNEN